jgi:hypothetical protein
VTRRIWRRETLHGTPVPAFLPKSKIVGLDLGSVEGRPLTLERNSPELAAPTKLMTQSASWNKNLQSHDKEMGGMAQVRKGRARTSSRGGRSAEPGPRKPTRVQAAWLARGLSQAGGKLPLFDIDGRRISEKTIRACMSAGWAEPWFSNPIKPDWLVCRLTDAGRAVVSARAS